MGAVVIAAVAIGGAKILLAKPPVPAVTTVGLERRELVNQVGVSGVVESAQGMQVLIWNASRSSRTGPTDG